MLAIHKLSLEPPQPYQVWRLRFTSVGVLRIRSASPWPRAFLSVNARSGWWQVTHEMYPTGERRGSRNNRRPSSIAMGMPETRLLLSTCVEGGQGPNASTRCISSRVSIWAGLVCVQAWPEARFTTSINARHKFIMAPLASQNSMSCSTTLDPVTGAVAGFSSRAHQSRTRTVVTGAEIVPADTCITGRKHAGRTGNHHRWGCRCRLDWGSGLAVCAD